MTRLCPLCQKQFNARNSEQKYCSRGCANKGRAGIKYDGSNKKNKVAGHTIRRNGVIARDGEACKICGLGPEWNGLPIRLQVDHVNGNRKDHSLANLRLLCPNCHSQTETFGSKNIGRWPVNTK